MAFDIDLGYATRPGRKARGEDFVAAMLPPSGRDALGAIAAIADGVSAGGLGREAAQTTVTTLVQDFHAMPETWETTVALDRLIGAQNAWLAGMNRRRRPAAGMTTLTALVLRGHGWSVAHVGDSRAWLWRRGELAQLTGDHVVGHPDRSHGLLRALGADDRVVVDYLQGDVELGDVFVLTTDGVHGAIGERRLRERLLAAEGAEAAEDAEPSAAGRDGTGRAGAGRAGASTDGRPARDAQALARELVELAATQGSTDDATALVLRVRALSEATLDDARRRADTLPVPPRLAVGDTIDGLEVVALVADTGVHRVYRVRHPRTGAHYALKALHPGRAHDAQERAMLAHEAWLGSRMRTSRGAQHLVALRDRAELPPVRGDAPEAATAFYVLHDWHPGQTLQQRLDHGPPIGVAQAVQIAGQAARAIGALHRQRVIHRDIKPANLHQGEDGVLRLLDLGVALSGREPESTRLLHAGTASYVNPEQWGYGVRAGEDGATSSPPEPGSDLFALGVTMYQLLTGGRLPYGEVLPYQSGRYWRDPRPPSRLNPEVPIWLDHVVLKAIARDRRDRFETAEELMLALERGASRPLTAPSLAPLIRRDPTMPWKLMLAISALLNALLVGWLLFLPT